MKNTLLIIVALLVCFKSQAQLSKGRMMLSGSVNYSNNHSSRIDTGLNATQPIDNSNSFNGILRYGYFVTNKIMVGVYGGYSHSDYNFKSVYFDGNNYINQTSNNMSNNFSGGIFSRYYQMLGKSRFALFGQLSVGYSAGKQEQKTTSQYPGGSLNTTNSHGDMSSITAAFNPGIVFFITKNIAIETTFGSMGFSTQRTKNYNAGGGYNETKNSTFNSNLGFNLSSLSWGVNFYFGGKKDKAETPGK